MCEKLDLVQSLIIDLTSRQTENSYQPNYLNFHTSLSLIYQNKTQDVCSLRYEPHLGKLALKNGANPPTHFRLTRKYNVTSTLSEDTRESILSLSFRMSLTSTSGLKL